MNISGIISNFPNLKFVTDKEDEDNILKISSIAIASVLESSSSSVITVTPAKSAIKEAFLN